MPAKPSDHDGGHYVAPETRTSDSARVFDDTRARDWLNPIAMSTLKRAVERKQKTVILNGDDFTIEYGHVTKLPLTGDRKCVKVYRTDRRYQAPFGYIAIETLEKFEFES